MNWLAWALLSAFFAGLTAVLVVLAHSGHADRPTTVGGVAFIAWATFYHCGGKEAGLGKALTNNIFGAVMALIALLLVTQVPLGGALGVPLWAGICVLITVFILVYAAKAPALSDIPAGVLGYAAVAGLALTGNKLGAVTSASLENPFVVGVISLIIGAVLGYFSQKIALALVKE